MPLTDLRNYWDYKSLTDLSKMARYFLKQEMNFLLRLNHISTTIMRKNTMFDMKAYSNNVLIHVGVILLKLLVFFQNCAVRILYCMIMQANDDHADN